MNEKQKQLWAQTRTKGKKRFIIRFGVFWGFTTGLLNFSMMSAYYFYENNNDLPSVSFLIFRLITSILVFFLIGLLLGLWHWNSTQKEFLKVDF